MDEEFVPTITTKKPIPSNYLWTILGNMKYTQLLRFAKNCGLKIEGRPDRYKCMQAISCSNLNFDVTLTPAKE